MGEATPELAGNLATDRLPSAQIFRSDGPEAPFPTKTPPVQVRHCGGRGMRTITFSRAERVYGAPG